jgi:hypothetical protein
MSTSVGSPTTQSLGTVAFKGDKIGNRVAVTLQIMDLVRTNSPTLRAAVDVLITPIGLQLFAVPVFVKDGKISFAPSRRDIPRKTDDDNEYEYTFGFAAKAHRDIFWDLLKAEQENYCQRHHRQTLASFLEINERRYEMPSQGTVPKPAFPAPLCSSSPRYIDPIRKTFPSRLAIVQ